MDDDPANAPIETEILPDGTIVDQSGEIVGLSEVSGDFHVTDKDKAEWVLSKMLDQDAAIAGLNAKERAIIENIDTQRRYHDARRKYFEWRFGAELAAFARANLKGKQKTWTCAYGKVSFRMTQRGIEIGDEKEAISWIRSAFDPLIVIEAVKVTEKIILSVVKEKLLADPPPAGHGIAVKEAGENVKIETGVK